MGEKHLLPRNLHFPCLRKTHFGPFGQKWFMMQLSPSVHLWPEKCSITGHTVLLCRTLTVVNRWARPSLSVQAQLLYLLGCQGVVVFVFAVVSIVTPREVKEVTRRRSLCSAVNQGCNELGLESAHACAKARVAAV